MRYDKDDEPYITLNENNKTIKLYASSYIEIGTNLRLPTTHGLGFYQGSTEVAHIDKKSFKFTSDDNETLELSTPGGNYGLIFKNNNNNRFDISYDSSTGGLFRMGYLSGIGLHFETGNNCLTVRYNTGSNRLELKENAIKLYSSVSTLPIYEVSSSGRVNTSTVYYKYPTGLGFYNVRQINTGNGFLYDTAYNSSNQGATNANWGRQDSAYAINFRKNILLNGSIILVSDERIKKDIVDNTKPSLDIINAIQLKEYNYKYRPNESGVKTIGVIAQQIKRDIDEVYGTDIIGQHDEHTSLSMSNDEYTDLLSIKKEKIYLHLIGAVQTLTKKNKSLEDELVSTKLKMAELQEQIDDKTNYSLNERLTLLEKQIAEIDISKYFN